MSTPSEILLHVLLALAAVVATGRLLAWLFRAIGQPPVIGEVVGGIVLGPSCLGLVWPQAGAFLLPSSVAPYLQLLAQLGVILYMFVVGLELNPRLLRTRARAAGIISTASMATPLLLGAAIAPLFYPDLAGEVPLAAFALFVGMAIAVTAFPVLARILTDRRMQRTPLGGLALGCAALNDVAAWCLLALAIGVARAQVTDALRVIGWTIVFVVVMLLLVRPLAVGLLARFDREGVLTPGILALVLVGVLLSALVSEWIGIHALFGAFLLGALIPPDTHLARALHHRLEGLVTVLFLPAFFAFTGMRTRIGLVTGLEQWLLCGLITLVAILGKFGGTLAAARWTGLGWRDAVGLGALLNTRGMMELIVLSVGLDMHILSPVLFAMMVLMALVTTMTTGPILSLVGPFTDGAADKTRAMDTEQVTPMA